MGESAVTTIMFTDLVDSTGMLDRLGDDAAHRASQDHLTLLREVVLDHGGREVKSLGDGLMTAFSSAVSALRCAIAMQRRVHSETPGVGLRVGLDAGEPIVEAGDLFGTPVVVARRLCDLAGPGQILVSELVRGLVGRRVEQPMAPNGPTQVKGLTAPVNVWSVSWPETHEVPATLGRDARTRVLIVDDQRLVRAGFRVILDSEPDLVVVGEAGDGEEAIEKVRQLAPDVVLMDIRMPRMDGLEAARTILANTAARVVMLSTFDVDDYVFEALRIGASGFLLKDSPPEQLANAVRCAVAGDALIDPALTRHLINHFTAGPVAPIEPVRAGTPEVLRDLTPRELDVFRELARGLSNAEIAAALVVEETTVKTHVARILMKLGLRDRVQAVVLAHESGFASR